MFDKFFDSNIDFFKSLLVVATIFLLLSFYAIYKYEQLKQYEKKFNMALYIVAALSFFSFINMGFMHYSGGYFHVQDVFHRYMGAKYFKEAGYKHLYEAAIVADSEQDNYFGRINSYRDQETFQIRTREEAINKASEWRGAFTNERWNECKNDLTFFKQRPGMKDVRGNPVRLDWWGWPNILNDFGLEPSPVWVMAASLVANIFSPASAFTMHVVTSLDFVLFIVAGYFLARAFSVNIALFTFIGLFTMNASIYSWAGSSFLRFDWLAYLIISLSLLKEGKFRWAGVALAGATYAYSIIGLFLLPVLAKIASDYYHETKINQEGKQFFIGFFAVLIGLGVLSFALVSHPLMAWEDFFSRSVEIFKNWNLWDWSMSDIFIWAGEVTNRTPDLWQAQKLSRFNSLMPIILLMKAAALILVIMAIRRFELWESLVFGSAIIFTFVYVSQVNFGYMILLLPFLVVSFERSERLLLAAAFYLNALVGFVIETFQKNDFFLHFISATFFATVIGGAIYVVIWRENAEKPQRALVPASPKAAMKAERREGKRKKKPRR